MKAKKSSFPSLLKKAQEHAGALRENVDIELLATYDPEYPATWTGNPAAGAEFLTFAEDGTGSGVCFWLHDSLSVGEAPVVFLGSEGDSGVIAGNVGELLMLVALGHQLYDLARGTLTEAPKRTPAMVKWLMAEGIAVPKKPLAWVQAAIDGHPDIGERLRDLAAAKPADRAAAAPSSARPSWKEKPDVAAEVAKLARAKNAGDLEEIVRTTAFDEVLSPEVLEPLFLAIERCAAEDELVPVWRVLSDGLARSEYRPHFLASFERSPTLFTMGFIQYVGDATARLRGASKKALSKKLSAALKKALEEAAEPRETSEPADNSGAWTAWNDEYKEKTLDLHYTKPQWLNARDIEHLAKAFGDVEHLRCRAFEADAIEKLALLRHLKTLAVLYLERIGVHELLPVAPKVVEIKARDLRTRDLVVVGRFTNLERLTVSGDLRDWGFAEFASLEKLKQLKTNGGSGLWLECVSSGLEELDLSELSRGKPVASDVLKLVATKTKLRVLELDLNAFEPGALRPLEALHDLEVLSVGATGQKSADLTFLAGMPKLRTLTAFSNPIDDRAMPFLSKLTALERLSLRGTKVSDASTSALSELRHLKYLDLAETKVTDAGLAALAKLPAIESLELDGKEITDAAESILKELKKRGDVSLGSKCRLSKAVRKTPGRMSDAMSEYNGLHEGLGDAQDRIQPPEIFLRVRSRESTKISRFSGGRTVGHGTRDGLFLHSRSPRGGRAGGRLERIPPAGLGRVCAERLREPLFLDPGRGASSAHAGAASG